MCSDKQPGIHTKVVVRSERYGTFLGIVSVRTPKLSASSADWEARMDFGYFTLSDNHYENNRRGANTFVADIIDEAVYAEEVGLHSAWIGEHHFSTLGVLSCPDLVLANVAARTQRIRLAPAVTVLPLHHPIRVAEQWATLDLLSGGRVDFAAGRGYDRREYLPLKVSFEDNQEIFDEGMEVVRRLWSSDQPISHHGKHYQFDDLSITPKPVQRPIPAYVASFSQPSIELAGRLGCGLIVAPFAAAMTFGGLRQVAERHQQTSARHGQRPGRLMCSYFIHFADTWPKMRRRGRTRSAISRSARSPRCRVTPGRRRRATGILSAWSSGWANCARKTSPRIRYCWVPRHGVSTPRRRSRPPGSTKSSSTSMSGSSRIPKSRTRWRVSWPRWHLLSVSRQAQRADARRFPAAAARP